MRLLFVDIFLLQAWQGGFMDHVGSFKARNDSLGVGRTSVVTVMGSNLLALLLINFQE